MDVLCNHRVTYEVETHERIQNALSKIQFLSPNDPEKLLIDGLNHIIEIITYYCETFNIPKLIFELTPQNNTYPIYGTLHRKVNIQPQIQNIVIPNKAVVVYNVDDSAILPAIPDVSNIKKEGGDNA